MMYWFTGYIFDTFNELIQMFYARKDLPSIIAAVLAISASCSPGVCGRTDSDPCPQGRGAGPQLRGAGPQLTGPLRAPPPFLGQNEFDGYSVTATCTRRWCSVIYTRCSH